jgi:hypothetical protein
MKYEALDNLLVIIRNDETPSLKTRFLLEKICEIRSPKAILACKRNIVSRKSLFYTEVQLASSPSAFISYYLLSALKSPKNLRDGLMARLSIKKRKNVLYDEGFLSTLSRLIYLRFGTAFNYESFLTFLRKYTSPKVFIIDEFVSLHSINLKELKKMGPLIYISQDVAYNRFGFNDNLITRHMAFNLERDFIKLFDLVVACSQMEQLKYIEMGATNTAFYPNLYPIKDFEPSAKTEVPSVCIVLRNHWGPIAEKFLNDILYALSLIKTEFLVYVIGTKPELTPKNLRIIYTDYLPSKIEYLKLLSKSWVAINVGIHMAGTNERKYDYASAGLVVLSDQIGARGDLLPHEYTYTDIHDLAAKISQLLQIGKTRLSDMGAENRTFTLFMADNSLKRVIEAINVFLK